MDQSTEKVPQPSRWKHHPLLVVFRLIREFGNQIAVIKIKWLLAAGLIFVASAIFTQAQFNDVNARERDKQETSRLHDQYLIELSNYNASVSANTLCRDGVKRSNNNREQWADFAGFIENLDQGGGQAKAFADQVRTGPVLSEPARGIEECPKILSMPKAPDDLAASQGTELPNAPTTSTP